MGSCLYCGNELSKKQYKYCSKLCKTKSYQKKKRFEYKEKTGMSLQSAKGVERKLSLIEEFGGGCSVCGYNKNLSALEFHHLENKKFQLDARRLSNNSLKTIREEVVKCILLCSNCHQELHNPHLEIYKLKYGELEK